MARLPKIYTIPINQTYDIPYISASNDDGSTIYLDKNFHPYFEGKDIRGFIKIHEIVERAVLDLFTHKPYDTAHAIALRYHRKCVENAGLNWDNYQDYLRMSAKVITEIVMLPEDIYIVPYVNAPKEIQFLRSKAFEEAPKPKVKERLGITETKIHLQYHSVLNPALWDNDFNLLPLIKDKLLALGYMWAEYTHIPKNLIQDIIMTGGNANYNYTPTSDIDIHVMVNKADLGIPAEFLDDYLQDKKKIWSSTNSITVKGYPIELYAQDVNEGVPANQGVYSLLKGQWIQKPTHLAIDFASDHFLKRKVLEYVHQIDNLIKSKASLEDIKSLRRKLKEMRGAAIKAGGEFSFENLVFKELRNRKSLDKLNKYMKRLKDKELSL